MTPPSPDTAAACRAFLITFGLGFLGFGYGMWIRLGRTKRYFLTPGPAPFFGPANYHVIILFGAVVILFGVAMLPADPETGRRLLEYLVIPSFILAFIVGLWQPWWLKPKWIRQLKENHPDIYPLLREAVALLARLFQRAEDRRCAVLGCGEHTSSARRR